MFMKSSDANPIQYLVNIFVISGLRDRRKPEAQARQRRTPFGAKETQPLSH